MNAVITSVFLLLCAVAICAVFTTSGGALLVLGIVAICATLLGCFAV